MFTYFSTKTYAVGTQKNPLNEHPKHMFKRMDKKIIAFLHTKILLEYGFYLPLESPKIISIVPDLHRHIP